MVEARIFDKSRVLTPKRSIWIIVINKLYNLVRDKGGIWSMISDLTDVSQHLENIISGAKNLGASLDDVLVVENPTVAQISELIMNVKNIVCENNRFGNSTHVHLNYLGHSVMKEGSTFAICNDSNDIFMYRLETIL